MKEKIEALISEIERYIDGNKKDTQFAQGGNLIANLVNVKLRNIINE